ncbi:bifunctional UDP-sugar hydrolase/5'-nucleotidase [Arcanobacterium wilhelmae]|uniref:bifunctional metallophosphatase/5'-nucleotidase n=1 Tax=Arcanobacterium wilhelmae TaxID=1803177 RepID=UPI002414DD5A|nr:bifunctional UDP-sugar hydrolase/5'-nucleotidase [Arcanobacterium wilhelmae]WFN90617.1 bifunctional UDP-sugar hydrolase/5'-nucleotidase [Arcanobacterium wilhelmae]
MRNHARFAVGSLATAALAFAPLTAMAAPAGSETTGGSDVVTLDLYNLTDIHGHIEAVPGKAEGTYKEAGLAAASCYFKQAKKANPNSQLTLLGDNIGASPFTSGSDNDNPTIAALNEMEVFASTIGNHEFDKGVPALKDRFAGKNGFTQIKFDYLGANVEGLKELGSYKIWTSPSGVKVAFIGAIEDDVATKLAPGTVDMLKFNKPVPIINSLATKLKAEKKADVVIAMFDNDVERSYPLMGKDVDGIMGGDTHKPYFDFNMVKANDGHTITATASGSFTDNMSNLQIKFDKATGKVVESKAIKIDATTLVGCGEDPAVKAIVDKAVAKAKEAKAKVVTEGTGNFYRGIQTTTKDGKVTVGENRGTESTLGSLIGDAMKGAFKDLDGKPIDIGIINAGGIRADLEPKDGKVTVGDIFAFMPFSNEVGYVKMTGAQFTTLLEQQWKTLGKDSSRPMLKLGLSSNVKYTYDPTKPMGERITSVLIDNMPIDPAKVYSVGSVTFLLAGGDSFDVLKDPSIAKTLTTVSNPLALDREWMESYLKANPKVQPRTVTQSTGITFEPTVKGTDVEATVALRGLSFTHEGEFMPKEVTIKLGDASAKVAVNNTLEDANAANENAVITADGVGFTEPVMLQTKAVCTAPAGGTVHLPLTVTAPDGTEIVSAAAGLGMDAMCPAAPKADDKNKGGQNDQSGTDDQQKKDDQPNKDDQSGTKDQKSQHGNNPGDKPNTNANGKPNTGSMPMTGVDAASASLAMLVLLGLGGAAISVRKARK